jgi:hypothetical protein
VRKGMLHGVAAICALANFNGFELLSDYDKIARSSRVWAGRSSNTARQWRSIRGKTLNADATVRALPRSLPPH